MKKKYLITQFKKIGTKKKPWKSLLGNFLLSNLISLTVSLIQCACEEKVTWKLNFSINNALGLIVWAFNLFYPW